MSLRTSSPIAQQWGNGQNTPKLNQSSGRQITCVTMLCLIIAILYTLLVTVLFIWYNITMNKARRKKYNKARNVKNNNMPKSLRKGKRITQHLIRKVK